MKKQKRIPQVGDKVKFSSIGGMDIIATITHLSDGPRIDLVTHYMGEEKLHVIHRRQILAFIVPKKKEPEQFIWVNENGPDNKCQIFFGYDSKEFADKYSSSLRTALLKCKVVERLT